MDELNEMNTILDKLFDKKRLEWKTYFTYICLLASKRSNCERLKVGCILVKDNRIISTAYNGFLPNAPHISRVVDNHEQSTVHAEMNAIADCASRGISVKNATCYVTHFTCINCFKILAASNIKEIIYINDYKNNKLVNELALESGIKISKFF